MPGSPLNNEFALSLAIGFFSSLWHNFLSRLHSGAIVENQQQQMLEAINATMPFGKYAGRKLLTLPEPYLVWFSQQGFPQGKLGQQLALIHEIKVNGLETMLAPLLRDE